jgi:hypothetical protein
MGAEHSRRLHLRKNRQPTSSVPPVNGAPPLVSGKTKLISY